jgi:hypothetical protein
MIMVDAGDLPIAVNTAGASPHQSALVEPLFDFMLTVDSRKPIGDKAYDSDNSIVPWPEGSGNDLAAPRLRTKISLRSD